MLGQHTHEGVSLERNTPGDALVQDDTERVDVHPVIEVLARRLLGRHVLGRAEDHPSLRELSAGRSIQFNIAHLGDPEVDDLDEIGDPVAGR